MNDLTRNELQRWFAAHDISEVECLFADMTGNARGKCMPATKFLAEQLPRLPESALVQTVTGQFSDEHNKLVDPGDHDMVLMPDPSTARIVPWTKEKTAQIIHDVRTIDGQLHPLSSRNVLRRIVETYKKIGLEPVVAPEVEFYLIEKNDDPDFELRPPIGRSGRNDTARQSYSIDALNEYQSIINEMHDFCIAQELDIDTWVHESGSAQFEVNFRHGDPLKLADQVFVFNRTMREVALRHGIYAPFMAKPMQDEPGSALHIHQSIKKVETGENIFADREGDYTPEFYHYLGGLQQYTPKLISLYAPNVNSYRRFTKDISAPINLNWGFDNRTLGLRVPTSTPQNTRIENRFAGVDTNPYLAFASTLACGYLGLKNRIQPLKPHKGDASEQDVELIRSMEVALLELDNVGEVGNLLGNEFIRAFKEIKLNEFEEFNQVISSWERKYLLLKV